MHIRRLGETSLRESKFNLNQQNDKPTMRWRVWLAILLFHCVWVANYVGLASLLGTDPSGRLAPIFVLGVGMYWTQFQLLGFFAALLPYRLYWRLFFPLAIVLALCLELRLFNERFGLDGIAFASLTGFVSSWVGFLIYRAVRGLRLQSIEEDMRDGESVSRFGIEDIMTTTFVVAIVFAVMRLEAVESGPFVFLISAFWHSALLILYAPMNFWLFGERRRIVLGLSFMFFIVVLVPSLCGIVAAMNDPYINYENWAILYCLTLGPELAWLIGLGCMKALGFRLVSGKKPLDPNPIAEQSSTKPC